MPDPPPQEPTPPTPPQAPQPPAALSPAGAQFLGTTDPRALARRLVNHMRKKATVDFSVFPPSLLHQIEQAMILELDAGEIATYGYKLRNMLRFAIAEQTGLVAPHAPVQFKIDSQGTERKPPVALKGRGSVSMQLDGKLEKKDAGDAFVLTYSGDSTGVHWLQFISRRIVIHFPAAGEKKAREVPLQKRYTFKTKTRVVVYTDDPKRPRWSTDGLDPNSPFYEGGNAVKREARLLQLTDSPGPNDMDVKALFAATNPPSKCISTFTAAAYLIKDREVLYRADLSRSWTITKVGADLKSQGEKWSGRGQAVSKIEPEHRATLALQFPQWDYLPGDRFKPPVPRPSFQPLSLSHPDIVNWPDRPLIDRLRAAAKAANAKLIEDVEEDPDTEALKIHDGSKKDGLNFFAALRGNRTNPVGGETGFVDEAGTYHNPALPHVRAGGLPKVAMILGEDAFQWGAPQAGGSMPNKRDKFYTLGVMRHEMMHGVHGRVAAEWLLKWRDELTRDDFVTWLNKQLGKQLSALEHELVLTGVPPLTTGPTEVLAFTEGFVTALPFLPASPTLAAFAKKEEWPASIAELDGLLRKMGQHVISSDLKAAQDLRLDEVICGVLEKQQRDALVQWMDFLTSVDPEQASAAEKPAAKLFKAAFGSGTQFLLGVRKMAQNC